METDRVRDTNKNDVAVVAMSCRLPGAANPREFWKLLSHGEDALGKAPGSRREMFRDHGVEKGGFLAEVESADGDFFGITEGELQDMDPQQVLSLELFWELLEDAGRPAGDLAKKAVGVFMGVATVDHTHRSFRRHSEISPFSNTGAAASIISNRLSYSFNLRGPSMTVDTACSSSLSAVHLARRAIENGECEMAAAGGVNLMLHPGISLGYERAGLLARDGRCKPFDARADGIVRGEGGGMVLLKPLERALADGDRIYGVIRGSGVNQDGRSAGLPAPNRPAQARLLRETYKHAGVAPHTVDFVETHGTGTRLGDPIEAGALGDVLGKIPDRKTPLLIGSVKSNVGHLEAAAGITGLIKTLLMLSHQRLVANVDFQKPNPFINFEQTGLWVSDQDRAWEKNKDDTPRRAGVSSFGFGGSNAHVILEEAPPGSHPETRQGKRNQTETSELLLLSAANEQALRAQGSAYLELIRNNSVAAADLVRTAALHREQLSRRASITFRDREELEASLESLQSGATYPALSRGTANPGRSPKLAFVYSGQGPAVQSYRGNLPWQESVFNDSMEELDQLVRREAHWSLLEMLNKESAAADQPEFAQPILFCIQMALTDLWNSLGVSPRAVVGHSLGEIAAAVTAGALNRETGLRLALRRGTLIQKTAGKGAMAVLGLNPEETESLLAEYGEGPVVAALNDEQSTVISGERAAIQWLVEQAEARKIFVHLLQGVDFASHSPLMDEAARDLSAAFNDLSPADTVTAFYSTVTPGTEILNGEYWGRNLRERVNFSRAVEAMEQDGYAVFLEVSSASLLARSLDKNTADKALVVPGFRGNRPGREALLDSLGALHAVGVPLKLKEIFPKGKRIPLPLYPFQRKKYYSFLSGASRRNPNPATILNEIQIAGLEESRKLPLDLDLENSARLNEHLDDLTDVGILNCLAELGLFSRAGRGHTLKELCEIGGVREDFRPLLERWLSRLVDNETLILNEDRYVSMETIRPIDIQKRPKPRELRIGNGEKPILEYFLDSAENLSRIVRGEKSSLETLFPGGEFHRANDLYRNNPVARFYNDIVARSLQAAAARIPRGKSLRVLEIGAGTGGTTARALPLLAPFAVDYCFTDLSNFFFREAKTEFESYDFLKYRKLNIERAPDEQGFAPGSFDVVIATNAIHAARDLKQALGHARSLLAPGGFLILNEVSEYRAWFDVTTALIEGWRRFDDGVRGDVPLLPVEGWEKLLATEFETVKVYPEPDSPVRSLGQEVFMAFASGDAAPIGGKMARRNRLERNEDNGERIPSPTIPRNKMREEIMEGDPKRRAGNLRNYLRERIQRLLPAGRELDEFRPLAIQGFDSLSALELLNQIRMDLGAELPVQGLRNNPSLEDLVRLFPGLRNETSAEDFAPTSAHELDPRLSLLQQEGELAPLILIHPGGLDLGCYEYFSRSLAGRRPLYVLAPPELNFYGDMAGKKTDSIQEGARLCAEILNRSKILKPDVSFRLGGWSFGGVLSWETTRILESHGLAPEELVLFDSFQAPGLEEAELKRWFAASLRLRFGMKEPGEPVELLQRLQADGRLPAATSPADMREFYRAYCRGVESCLEQVMNYVPEKVQTPVKLFEARDERKRMVGGHSLWDGVYRNPEAAPAGFTVHQVTGDHYGIWGEAGSDLMARDLGAGSEVR